MAELTPSTREVARRIGVTETALRKAAAKGRIEWEPDGQWDVVKTRRRMIETADPARSPLAPGGAANLGGGAGGGGGARSRLPIACGSTSRTMRKCASAPKPSTSRFTCKAVELCGAS